jgi:hypothetical protein
VDARLSRLDAAFFLTPIRKRRYAVTKDARMRRYEQIIERTLDARESLPRGKDVGDVSAIELRGAGDGVGDFRHGKFIQPIHPCPVQPSTFPGAAAHSAPFPYFLLRPALFTFYRSRVASGARIAAPVFPAAPSRETSQGYIPTQGRGRRDDK